MRSDSPGQTSSGDVPADRRGSPANAESLSWPLVERRSEGNGPSSRSAIIDAAPLAPFRVAALILAFIRGADEFRWSNWSLIVAGAIVVVFTIFSIWRPVPYSNDNRSRLRALIELAIVTGAVMASGAWSSPFALCLVPTAMLASFVGGTIFSAQLIAGAAGVITLQHFRDVDTNDALTDSALWIGLLGLVTVTIGLSFRTAQASAQQQQAALDRVGRLAEANALLFSLQRVAQTLPASLDLDEVLDSMVARVDSLINHSMLTIFLQDDGPDRFETVRVRGYSPPDLPHSSELPSVLLEALNSPKTVRGDNLDAATEHVAPMARSGLYAALRARGSVIGLIAVESLETNHFGQQQAEILHGLAEPFGIAIDNARLFRRLRIVSADEERNRIARDLHDHIGSSLAYLGYEIDRSIAAASRGEPVESALAELRMQVTRMVGEVRETLYDLRSDVSENQDLSATLKQFVDRVRGRSGLDIAYNADQRVRLALVKERELWHIAREALINVERHAQATKVSLEWVSMPSHAELTIRDNGIGMRSGPGRVDSYGMRGMRERAATIGAEMTTESTPAGTVIRIGLHEPEGARLWH